MARSKSSAAARFSAIFRRNPRAKREKLPAVDIGYSLGPGCCQQRPRVRSLIPDSASRLALDEPQSRDGSTSVLSRRGCGDRKQGRLLDRALRGALSLKPGVSSLLKLRKASTRVSNLVSRRSVLRTRPQRERDRKFADSARSQFEATQEEVQPASARDFSMSRENPAISCSSSPSAASDEPRKPPLQELHEELLPLPSTDGTLQLRNRWFADSSLR